MSRKVRLTWKDSGSVRVEDCYLISDKAQIYTNTEPIQIEIPELIDELAKEGYVVFEDDDGIFVLTTNQVMSVEILNEGEIE